MSALGGKAAGGDSINPVGTVVGLVIILVSIGITAVLGSSLVIPLIGIIVGGALIAFGVHFVPVGGAPAAMGQAPGIATGVAMLAAGAGLAGLFGGAWAFETTGDFLISIIGGAVGGGLMMAITCLMVNATYVFAMGIPAASGKIAKDPITGDTFPEYKSQGTEGHGLPFISFVGGVIGGLIAGLGGTIIYIELLDAYSTGLATLMQAKPEAIAPLAISLAGIFAIGFFLVNAVLAAYNITGTIEGPHDPKFKRVPRAIIGCAVASAFCGLISLLLVTNIGM
ncbi:tetrahydromethanopterin S-methyltransferase subunit D [Methanospirillum lacunae]|uniref:Tetrahydromethanopterin S-methyltransferase subunit D n=1 Tax=Methanospirillum lacunae TaxID=668570 RepID=A0A2V2MRP4_9EURY|nr:tetrahydromethanopterin S-methyltransferase subunit D [Methanospirillum lacunae]PWR70904.1 tetrahydromethanopterin S-methyltransferase subunit D [Methanospirillum lacunae]